MQPDSPVLIGQTGPLNGERFSITGEIIIGRESTCTIVVLERQVSRYHARITIKEDGVLLEDLGSKNGTYVNGEMIAEPVMLQDGDVIQVALVQQFVYLNSDATLPLVGNLPFPGMVSAGAGSAGERVGCLYLDPRSRRVWLNEEEVLPPLSVPQFRLLQVLYDQQGKVVSRQALINLVWSEDESEGVSEQALDALIRRLRDRLAQLDASHAYLVTVRGHGLRLDNPER
ncbi:response regulators consisting of a CheY-like receiver domain and a winged-helix DNA-binding domain [Longilinea arvoryzae]|uniref:Response regulators consisting of a CheY-like receiver domain and a winged-helix DNA-binding domain n=1 Tax=Longilinea arvoryzae TaxID=360412 RepID=A0A0S7BJW4_9CHLR|nr:FHA domain-containing protein [Longilinea arvoryzae]GAP14235.1 response regulators consisting of a CheY-like receiver domain and a winged-helix DNA-binding domain [Longilinea arvoryzae]